MRTVLFDLSFFLVTWDDRVSDIRSNKASNPVAIDAPLLLSEMIDALRDSKHIY
jgi:hypothetical protein